VSESLSYLHNEDLLFLDSERQWRWDLDKIRQSRMPTTVVALFSSKIQKLPPDLVIMLEYCACMGNTFSPTELAAIRGEADRYLRDSKPARAGPPDGNQKHVAVHP
jgi:predicted ATPase